MQLEMETGFIQGRIGIVANIMVLDAGKTCSIRCLKSTTTWCCHLFRQLRYLRSGSRYATFELWVWGRCQQG